MVAKALCILAEGSEEMETVIIVDVLRRGGVEVVLAGLEGVEPVKCSRGVVLVPDSSLDSALLNVSYDAIILPGGGPGAKALAESAKVKVLLTDQEAAGRIVGAICAAPTALLEHGIGKGKRLTSYPSFKDVLSKDYIYTQAQVEVDGSLITSQGPGTSFSFALRLVELLVGKEKAEEISAAMLL
ncbi:protein/nucleic acid deglycase DJ-1 [Eurytemora carolleeae]|uniref:protein/nucleic acid deglycase DJ-1 n=1 Tax=Eurytemora carolleeae TaxID=1294199 RepID=UPI000C78672B|nr:protein/nucleic acid deglycase DJ-1 [Eurytemora carolleeae]|eukprot:XP_023328211.1 protein/nucleic acid deglycase DJ-1-like [Eurytemora affinis]